MEAQKARERDVPIPKLLCAGGSSTDGSSLSTVEQSGRAAAEQRATSAVASAPEPGAPPKHEPKRLTCYPDAL